MPAATQTAHRSARRPVMCRCLWCPGWSAEGRAEGLAHRDIHRACAALGLGFRVAS
jgi:hypothetical protein